MSGLGPKSLGGGFTSRYFHIRLWTAYTTGLRNKKWGWEPSFFITVLILRKIASDFSSFIRSGTADRSFSTQLILVSVSRYDLEKTTSSTSPFYSWVASSWGTYSTVFSSAWVFSSPHSFSPSWGVDLSSSGILVAFKHLRSSCRSCWSMFEIFLSCISKSWSWICISLLIS